MKKRLKDNKTLFGIVSLGIVALFLPIIILLVRDSTNLASRAALPNQLETEGGILSSTNVTKQTDSGASGGSYVLFNKSAGVTNAPTPTNPPSTGKYPPSQTGATYISVPYLALPGYLQSVKDPTFAGTITRISNVDGYRNQYPKNAAWNVDGSYAFLGYGERLLDGNTYEDLGSIAQAPGRATWSNVDPDIIWGTHNGDNRLKKYSVSKNSTTYRTFSGYTEVDLGNGEGNISDDDKYVGLIAYPSTGGIQAMHFDIANDKILYTTTLPTEPDWVSVSHSGRYMVASYGPDGTGPAEGNKIYDRLSSNPSQPRHLYSKSSHSDFVTMEDGTEVLVLIDGPIKAVRLSDGASWNILSGSGFGHISGRAIDRPGWIYVSQNVFDNSSTPGHDQIAAVKVDGSQTVQVFSHARTIQPRAEYVYAESTHAVPNRDGTKVMWGGRWNDTGGMYSYVVEVK